MDDSFTTALDLDLPEHYWPDSEVLGESNACNAIVPSHRTQTLSDIDSVRVHHITICYSLLHPFGAD